jgi:V/A-type H+-transporting ATPase subunit C
MPKGGVFGYAAIQARVRAMYSTLLSPQEWAGLCDVTDLSALIAVLKETTYGPYLAATEEKDLTPRRAIYQIKQRVADVYTTLIRMSLAHTRPLVTQLYRHFELDNLKAVLRGIVTGASWDRMRYVLFPLGSVTVLPAQVMVEAGSVGAAVERSRDTPYYDTLVHAMKRYTAEQSVFPLEVALDLNYWRQVWRDANQLPSQDRLQALRIVGSLVDTNNLMWAARYRVYHHMSEEEIINYTLPFGYRARDEDIRSIAAGADVGQVVARIYPDLANMSTLLQEPQIRLPELEMQLQRHLAEQCRMAFSGNPFHIGLLLAYAVLSELEVQDLTVLIEAKAIQMPADRFRPYLLMGYSPQ